MGRRDGMGLRDGVGRRNTRITFMNEGAIKQRHLDIGTPSSCHSDRPDRDQCVWYAVTDMRVTFLA